ncbi:MAG: S8 family serine peptidase [Candidatus Margulisiibacteriota bacterium]
MLALSVVEGSFLILPAHAADYVPGEVLVKIKPGVKSLSDSSVASRFKARAASKIFRGKNTRIKSSTSNVANIYRLQFAKDINVPEMAKSIARESDVIFAEPNFIYYIDRTPDDFYFIDYPAAQNQWGLFKIGCGTTEGSSAWNSSQGDANTIIAIVDTGIQWDHPDLSGNVWINTNEIPDNGIDDDANGYVDDYRGWDFVNSDKNPTDDNGHGTHCSGIASAVTNNSTGIAGAGWNCKVMAAKAGNASGSFSSADSAAAITYAANNGAQIISMSWGSASESATITSAISDALAADCILFAAAGNDGTDDVHYPAATTNVISVASTDVNDLKSGFSNYGSWIDISAPGGGGSGTSAGNIYSTYPTNTYAYSYGTSMATPLAAGLAGLVRSKYSTLTWTQVRDIILNNATDIDALNPAYAGQLGSGRINALASLDTVSPTVSIISPSTGESFVKGARIDINWTATDTSGFGSGPITLYYTTGETFSLITSGAANTGTYSWRLPNVITSEARVKVQAVDVVGNSATAEGGSFNIVADTDPPTVAITSPTSGQRLAASVDVTGTATDDALTYFVLDYGYSSSPTGWTRITSSETGVVSGFLGTFEVESLKEGTYTLRLRAYDSSDLSSTTSLQIVVYSEGDATIVGTPLFGPSPFDPTAGLSGVISYTLSNDDEIKIYIFSIAGESLWYRAFASGSAGGSVGVNSVNWDGRDFTGNPVPNGVYLYRIARGGKTIGRGKFVVLR